MTEEKRPTEITVLDHKFTILCKSNEQEALLESAEFLNDKMRQIREHGKVIGLDRIAIMAALNIAHELLTTKTEKVDYKDTIEQRMQSLHFSLNQALGNTTALEVDEG